MKYILKIFFVFSITFTACSTHPKDNAGNALIASSSEGNIAVEMLQGIWFSAESETPFFKVEGDSLRFIEQPNDNIYFQISEDSLYTYGSQKFGYKIDRQSEYAFWFHSLSNYVVKLYKSDNEEDSIYFDNYANTLDNAVDTVKQVLQNDTVIFYDDLRLRGYAFINPSSLKVYKPIYSDEGVRIEQVYYDNVVYVCVYNGPEKLFGQNIYKEDMKGILDETFFNSVILEDMNFVDVDDNNYYYQAKVAIPNSLIFDIIEVKIDRVSFKADYELKNK